MTLLIGTEDGIYALRSEEFAVDPDAGGSDRDPAGSGSAGDPAETGTVVDPAETGSVVHPVERGPDVRGFAVDPDDGRHLAATDGGLLASDSPTEAWRTLGVPADDLWAVAVTPTGDLLVGTHDPADVYRSTDGGETWRRNERFAGLPRHDEWDNLAASSTGRVRTVAVHEDAPHRIAVGVEAEGVYVSEDDGRSWERRIAGLNHDVHHLLTRGPGEYVAACGRGLYRTDDAGHTWRALDTHRDCFWYTYYRESLAHRGRLYAAGQDRAQARFEDDARSRILVSEDGGRTFDRQEFPGCEGDFVNAWGVLDGRPVAGTIGGRLLARGDGDWVAAGETPATIRALSPTS